MQIIYYECNMYKWIWNIWDDNLVLNYGDWADLRWIELLVVENWWSALFGSVFTGFEELFFSNYRWHSNEIFIKFAETLN